jgi:hypothetical protein
MTSKPSYYPLIIEVMGLGSGFFNEEYIAYLKSQYDTIGFDNQDKQYILITTPTFDALGTIAKARFLRSRTVLNKNTFLKDLVAQIKAHIIGDEFTDVFLFGHSYGGAVIIRAAEELLKIHDTSDTDLVEQVKQKLHVRSYGSIYIPDAPLPIDAIHFSHVGDVALKVHNMWKIKEENAIGKSIVRDSENRYPTKGWSTVLSKYRVLSDALPRVYPNRYDIHIGCYNKNIYKNPGDKTYPKDPHEIKYSCETTQLSRTVKNTTRKLLGKNPYSQGEKSLSLSPGKTTMSKGKTRKYKLRGALIGTGREWTTHRAYSPSIYFDMFYAIHPEDLV